MEVQEWWWPWRRQQRRRAPRQRRGGISILGIHTGFKSTRNVEKEQDHPHGSPRVLDGDVEALLATWMPGLPDARLPEQCGRYYCICWQRVRGKSTCLFLCSSWKASFATSFPLLVYLGTYSTSRLALLPSWIQIRWSGSCPACSFACLPAAHHQKHLLTSIRATCTRGGLSESLGYGVLITIRQICPLMCSPAFTMLSTRESPT